jgi:hypothetical protein
MKLQDRAVIFSATEAIANAFGTGIGAQLG